MKQITSKILCNNFKGTGTSDTFAVGTSDGLSIQITGTATTFTADFEASLDGILWCPIEGCKASNMAIFGTSINKSNEIVAFDVNTVGHFRCNILTNNSADGITILAVNFIN